MVVRGPANQEDMSQVFRSCYAGTLASNATAMEKIVSPCLTGVGRRGGRASQSFSSPWGWLNYRRRRLGLAPRLNRRRVFVWLVSKAEGVGALASTHFNQLHACA